MLDKMLKDIWYGEIISENIEIMNEEFKILIGCLNQFKMGDFKKLDKLAKLIITTSNKEIYNLGMRIFMSVAKNEDFNLIEHFLGECDEDDVIIFITSAEESLSIHSVPYLLALMEEWEETGIESMLSEVIGRILGYEKARYELCTVDELGEKFSEFISSNDPEKYYYWGKEFFVGDFTKELMALTIECELKNKVFPTDVIPTILSINSGIKCPVSYGMKINNKEVYEVIEYIKKISGKDFIAGMKYFYGHKIKEI